MADDKRKRDSRDRNRVSVEEDYEVRYLEVRGLRPSKSAT